MLHPTPITPQDYPQLVITRHSTRAASKAANDRIHSLHLEESKGESRSEEDEPMNESAAARSSTSGLNKRKRSRPISDESDSDSTTHSSKLGSKSTVTKRPPSKRTKRTRIEIQESDNESEADEDESNEESDEGSDEEANESDEEEASDTVEHKTERVESDGMDDSDYEEMKKNRMKKPQKRKSAKNAKVKAVEVKTNKGKTVRWKKYDNFSILFALDLIRSTGSTQSEAALLGGLLTATPPIDVNLISPRYGDSIASSLFRVMIKNDLNIRVMERIRVNYDQIMKLLKKTINPAVLNAQGQNLLFSITDPSRYHHTEHGRQNRNPAFTEELTKILIEKGGEVMWRQPDMNGKVALFNQVLHSRPSAPSAVDLFNLLFPSVIAFTKVMAIRDGQGDTVLHCLYAHDTRPSFWAQPQLRFIELIELIMAKPDYFKLLDLNVANNAGRSLFDIVDEAATSLNRIWLKDPTYYGSDRKFNLLPHRIRSLFSQVSLVRQGWNEQLLKYMIPDLIHLVEEYLFFLEQPDVIRLKVQYPPRSIGGWAPFFLIELSPDSTLVQLKTSIQSAPSRISSHYSNEPNKGQLFLMNSTDPKLVERELDDADHITRLVDLGIRTGSVVQIGPSLS